jgi:hypothetical protein
MTFNITINHGGHSFTYSANDGPSFVLFLNKVNYELHHCSQLETLTQRLFDYCEVHGIRYEGPMILLPQHPATQVLS